MAMQVEEYLDELYKKVDDAKAVPLSNGKCMIERDDVLDIIDEIRAQFPVELAEARKLVARRADLEAEAKRKAENIIKSAEERAKQILSEETILLEARRRANEMVQQAEERSREMVQQAEDRSREMVQQAEDRSRELKRSAHEYCEDALRRTEEAVSEAYTEIKQSRANFRAASNTMSGAGSANPRPVYDAEADNEKA